jgi:hypothetical protein
VTGRFGLQPAVAERFDAFVGLGRLMKDACAALDGRARVIGASPILY